MDSRASSLGLQSSDLTVLGNSLGYPGLATLKWALPHFTIFRLPSFDPSSSWTLIETNSDWRVRRIVLAQVSEMGVWNAHTFGAEGFLSEATAIELLENLSALSIPLFDTRADSIGLDGMTCGLRLQKASKLEASFFWWGTALEGCAEVREFVARAIETFEAALPASSHALQQIHPWVE
jgi:hypothetical protein